MPHKFLYTGCFFLLLNHLLTAQFRCQEIKSQFSNSAIPSIQNNAKSDTIDILHYDINLDFTALPTRFIKGYCSIQYAPKLSNVNFINLDLLQLQVDSIVQGGQQLTYTYNDTLLHIALTCNLSAGDTGLLTIYYQGAPQGDGSGWGGWHQQSGYYYNLGVGFAANPHTYGRAWFPCFDNFIEKTTYDFHFKTVKPLKPYANGLKISETTISGDTIQTHWKMDDLIPTYLASVAISNYAVIYDTVSALNGTMPIQLMAKPADSLKIISSFQNLKPTFQALENAFGPYQWQKVGYAATTVGAMEHATSIHFPTSLINGTLSGEDIMAHELAHHWWGNLITCETDADMWINEGMAEYSSHLYAETVYGRQKYLETVMHNAYSVIENAHTQDDGYKAIQGLDHEYVYGFHVYQKGAMVAHNLRAYLGDSLFFNGLTTLLNNNAYGNLNSIEFRDQLAANTGKNLNSFFDNWVFNPGFPQVSIDSLSAPQLVQVPFADVKFSQRTHHAPSIYGNLPVYITFFSENGDTTTRKTILSGTSGSATFNNLPFIPKFALAGYSGHLLSADVYDQITINRNGSFIDRFSKMKLSASNFQDTARVIAMHHYAGPGGTIPASADYKMSSTHFWTVQGWDLDKANISARLNYRGTNNELDEDLVSVTEDSIMVLYRKDATEDWVLYPDQVKNVQSINTNGIGYISISNIKVGDYVFANTSEIIGINEQPFTKTNIRIFPNPAWDEVIIDLSKENRDTLPIFITDNTGKTLYETVWKKHQGDTFTVKTNDFNCAFIIVQVGDFAEKILLKN